jgi:hypothetical protein
MPRHQQSPRTFRIVSTSLAAIWLGAGAVGLIVGAVEHRWLIVIVGIAALWYGVIWARAARLGRRLAPREAVTPWRAR